EDPELWGDRLAWTAMQMRWSEAADERNISPLTEPAEVHAFINDFPGLIEVCCEFPDLTAEWAPQLIIQGFGGELEEVFDNEYHKDCKKRAAMERRSPGFGSDITTAHTSPACDERWALRHPNFGGYEPVYIANAFFSGQMWGPHPALYEQADHLFWL